MENNSNKAGQLFLITIAIIGWTAIILQGYLIIVNRTASVAETIIRFFSFFTILTNLVVALCCSLVAIRPLSRWGRFFARPATLTAITLYIAVVGIIYNVILRFLWEPRGLQLIVDEMLHSLIPLLFIVYWWVFVAKEILTWKHILPWLIYPLMYCIYILIRGEIADFYPYPFMDVNSLGYPRVFVNTGGVLIVFLMISFVLIAIARAGVKKKAAVNKNSR